MYYYFLTQKKKETHNCKEMAPWYLLFESVSSFQESRIEILQYQNSHSSNYLKMEAYLTSK